MLIRMPRISLRTLALQFMLMSIVSVKVAPGGSSPAGSRVEMHNEAKCSPGAGPDPQQQGREGGLES